MAETSTEGQSAEGARLSFRRAVTRLAVLGAVLVTAHLGLHTDVDEMVMPRVGNVVEVPPDDRTAPMRDEDLQKLAPTLLMVGGSQQSRFAAARARTAPARRVGGDMILDEFARELALRHPGDVGTFVRISQGNFRPIDQVAALGVLLQRAKWGPMMVVLAIDPFDATTEISGDTPEIFGRFPAAAAELFAGLGAVPGGSELVQRFAEARTHTGFKATGLGVEAELSKVLGSQRYYYGSRFGTPIKPIRVFHELEAPVLQSLFGRVQQPAAPRYLPPPEQVPRFAQKNGNHRIYDTFVRYLRSRGMTPVCFAAPWNPNSLPHSAATDKVVAKLGAIVTEAGCTFFDASRTVSASEENWGWEWGVPDDAHLMPPGIHAVGTALVTKGDEVGAWAPLFRAPVAP